MRVEIKLAVCFGPRNLRFDDGDLAATWGLPLQVRDLARKIAGHALYLACLATGEVEYSVQ